MPFVVPKTAKNSKCYDILILRKSFFKGDELMFGKKTIKTAIEEAQERTQVEILEGDIKDTEDLKTVLENKYSSPVYWCQAVSLIICALAIPQAYLNKEKVLMIFLILAAISMLYPMFYIAVVNEFIKKQKKLGLLKKEIEEEEN